MRNETRRIRRKRRERAAKNRRRRIFTRMTLLLSIIAVMTAAGISALTTAFARDTGSAYKTIIVAQGDTLWDIAAEYNFANRDVRSVVDAIMRANDMTSTHICVGDKLNIPIN